MQKPPPQINVLPSETYQFLYIYIYILSERQLFFFFLLCSHFSSSVPIPSDRLMAYFTTYWLSTLYFISPWPIKALQGTHFSFTLWRSNADLLSFQMWRNPFMFNIRTSVTLQATFNNTFMHYKCTCIWKNNILSTQHCWRWNWGEFSHSLSTWCLEIIFIHFCFKL